MELVFEQILDGSEVVKALILLPLTFQRLRITHGTASTHGFTIHHGDDPVHMHTAADGRPLESLEQGTGKSQATGFNDNAIKLIGSFQKRFHRWQEIVLNGAAEAAVIEFHKTAFHLLFWTETTAANQISVQANGSELIDHHGKSLTALGEQVPQNCGFAGAEEAGDHRDGKSLGHQRHPSDSLVLTPLRLFTPLARPQRALSWGRSITAFVKSVPSI